MSHMFISMICRTFFKCLNTGYVPDKSKNPCDRFFLWSHDAPATKRSDSQNASPFRSGSLQTPGLRTSPAGRQATQPRALSLQPKPTKEEASAVRCPQCQEQASLAKVNRENGNHGRWFYTWCAPTGECPCVWLCQARLCLIPRHSGDQCSVKFG